jgi:hypothetical protein
MVMVRRRPTARSRSAGLRRDALFMTPRSSRVPFRNVTCVPA